DKTQKLTKARVMSKYYEFDGAAEVAEERVQEHGGDGETEGRAEGNDAGDGRRCRTGAGRGAVRRAALAGGPSQEPAHGAGRARPTRRARAGTPGRRTRRGGGGPRAARPAR